MVTSTDRLSKKIYGKEYYIRCKEKGIDYAYYGNWQKQYAKMVVFVSEIYKTEFANKVLLDVGTACGANLRGFKETGAFTKVIGIDVSEYLIRLGRKVNNFSDEELIVDCCWDMKSIESESIDFLHCSQLFEHLEAKTIQDTVNEFDRVMKPGAIAFITLNAVKPHQTEEDVTSQDPTHISVMTERNWGLMFKDRFNLKENTEQLLRKAKFYPAESSKNFYEHYYDDWSVFVITK